MKKITFVYGSTAENRTATINQKGYLPIPFYSSIEGFDLDLFFLSLENSIINSSEIYVDMEVVTTEFIQRLKPILPVANVEISSLYLGITEGETNWEEQEKNFKLFCEIPHQKIYFNFFSPR